MANPEVSWKATRQEKTFSENCAAEPNAVSASLPEDKGLGMRNVVVMDEEARVREAYHDEERETEPVTERER